MTYKVELVPTEEGYSVACPEFPDCRSEGATEEEAIDNIKSAITQHLSVAAERNSTEGPQKKVLFIQVPEFPRVDDRVAAPPKPFTVKPFDLHLPPEWTSGCVEELIEMLEGPAHR